MPTVNYLITNTADDAVLDPSFGGFSEAVAVGDQSGSKLWSAWRFLGVLGGAVPSGAVPTAATLSITHNTSGPFFFDTGTGTALGRMYAADQANASALNPATINTIPKSDAFTAISFSSPTTTMDVLAQVEEWMALPGWAAGNAIAFVGDPTTASNAWREFFDYESDSTKSAVLSITYEVGGGSSYTLTADSGSFTLTGQAATLTYTPGPQSYTLTADSGSFSLTGQDVRLVAPSRPQSYFRKFPRFRGGSPVWYSDASVITGPEFWDAASAGSYVLTADPGSFVLTGQPATLTHTPAAGSYTLTADSGSFALSGQSAGLRASRRLTAAQGAFALTGIAAVLRASRKLVSAVGSFALTGQAANLRASRKLTAAQDSFSLAGQSVNLRASRKIGAGQGSFSLSGQAANLVYTPATGSYTIVASSGSFSLVGQSANLRASRRLQAASGEFAMTAYAAEITYTPSVTFRRFVAIIG